MITEKDIIKSESKRQEAVDKLIRGAQNDAKKFLDEYSDVLLDVISKNMISDETIKAIEDNLFREADKATTSLTNLIAQKFDGILNAENKYFDTLGIDGKVSVAEKKQIFTNWVSTMSAQYGEITTQERLVLRRMVRTAIGEGLSYEALKSQLEASTGKLKQYSATIADSAISQVSQAYNTLSARKAGLEYAWYAGTLTATTRPFCQYCYDKVFHISQIRQLRNGMLEPVLENCGGYNCRHRWVWVNPDWDIKLKKKLAGDGEFVQISIGQTAKATAYFERPNITDAWKSKFDQAKGNTLSVMKKELEAAEALQKTGYRVRMENVQNKKGGLSDAILIVDGNEHPLEIYSPDIPVKMSRIIQKISLDQSDWYAVHLHGDYGDRGRLIRRLSNRKTDRHAILLHDYQDNLTAERLWEYEKQKEL